MADLHNTILIGPDGAKYLLTRIELLTSPEPTETLERHDTVSIGSKIRRLRKEKGWSQSELGGKAGGFTQATISRIENDQTNDPHESTVSELLRVLTEPDS